MGKIYLDYAATTPVDPEVLKAMQPYFSERFGNAGSLHSFGQEASKALDESRETIAKALGADFREIIFTSSATESNNLALRGIFWSVQHLFEKPKVVVSSIEHESILETVGWFKKHGAEIVYLPVDKNGVVQLNALAENLDERTILVSIGGANNEMGVIQPISEIAKVIGSWKSKIENSRIYPLFHVDNAQGFQYLDMKPKDFGIDLLTISSHKIYGPKGAAALFRDQKSEIGCQISGGGQEFGFRSGTENIPAIVGFAKAVELVSNSRELENKRVSELRDYFWQGIKKIFPKAELNGPELEENRLPNNLNIYFPGHLAQDLLIKFDIAGVAISAGSACSARFTKLSHVLQACGFSAERIKSSLRITLGRPTTKVEIDYVLNRMKPILKIRN